MGLLGKWSRITKRAHSQVRRIERRLAEALDVPIVTFDPFAASKEDVTEQDFDGWQIDGDAAHFWDGGDVPKLTLLLPQGFELTDAVKALLEKAYDVGFSHGLESGRWTTQHEIRRALGLT